jgi:hypothetical protein
MKQMAELIRAEGASMISPRPTKRLKRFGITRAHFADPIASLDGCDPLRRTSLDRRQRDVFGAAVQIANPVTVRRFDGIDACSCRQ